MDWILNDTEVRVLGSLVEKQITTPDYYPLTLNSLTNACNQLSNREPVVSYDEETVVVALDSLREKKLALVVYASNSRVAKYRHLMLEAFGFTTQQELAVMCVLMLRGAQTVGEIRGHAGRLYGFKGLAEVEEMLEKLKSREERPLVSKLSRLAGHKEARYAHLLAGEVVPEEVVEPPPRRHEAAATNSRGENERLTRLEAEVEGMRGELSELQRQFENFKKQFE